MEFNLPLSDEIAGILARGGAGGTIGPYSVKERDPERIQQEILFAATGWSLQIGQKTDGFFRPPPRLQAFA